MTRTPLLAARRLGKDFDRRVVVHDVSLELHGGEVVALLGPNGAGKTTTMRLLAGLLRPSSGEVRLLGVRQTPGSWPAARGTLGLLTESPGLWDRLIVETNLLTFARLLGVPNPRRSVTALLEQFELRDRADDPAGNLSKGMRQKLALARALVHDPRVFLLDEPTAGLDPAMTRTFRDIIGRLRGDGRAILVSSHNLDEAERIADRIAVLDGTIVALDTPAGLAATWDKARVPITLGRPVDSYAELLRSSGVRDLTVSGGDFEGTVDDLTRDVPRIVRRLAAAGADVQAVVPARTSLEDVYLTITDRRSRTPWPVLLDEPQATETPFATPDLAASAGRGGRVAALLWKEWQDLRRSWAPWLPGLFILPVLAIPFAFTWLLPTVAGEALADSDFGEQLDRIRPLWPAVQHLNRQAATEAFVFQQFLVLVVLVPVAGVMAVAAHSIIGEKQTRSLEPLLATPLTALELLGAKVLGAFAAALLLEVVALTLYAVGIGLTADAGVAGVLASARSAIIVFLVAPFATLLGLQLVVLSSTRARDPRSAQQIGVLIVIPIVGVLVGQSAGTFWLTSPGLLLIAGALAALWVGLLVLSAATFDVEQVLTRWR